MGNKKVYLGSAILLLAAAAIGAGLWLQHRAEQKREERKKAIYGYWVNGSPLGRLGYWEVTENQVTAALVGSCPAAPAFIDNDGKAKVTATNPETKAKITFSIGDDLDELTVTGTGSNNEKINELFKRTTEEKFRAFTQPIDLGRGLKHYMDDERTILLTISSDGGMEFSKGSATLFVKSQPNKYIAANKRIIHSTQGRMAFYDPEHPDDPPVLRFNFFEKDTPVIYGKKLRPVNLKHNVAEKENVLKIVSTAVPPEEGDHWEKFFAKICSPS